MSQEKFWVLLSKKLSAEATADELQELENLITAHPEWQYAIQNLGDIWKHQPPVNNLHSDDAYLLHVNRMNEKGSGFHDEPYTLDAPRSAKKWYWIAAAAILTGLSFFLFPQIIKGKSGQALAEQPLNEVSTRQGSKSKIKLPDGTVVWLNAGSKLVYDEDFGQQQREVTLTGEGYFDVVKNKEKPFIIHTSNINIKVLGTVFNVKAYPEDKQTETSLIHGSIEVTIKNRPNDKIILSPNEKLVVENEAVSAPAKELAKGILPPAISINKISFNPIDSAVAETQWIDNKLVFNDESFAELAVRMQRWYNVEIDIQDAALLQKRLTGNFEKESVQQALDALKISLPFKYEFNGNRIIIHK